MMVLKPHHAPWEGFMFLDRMTEFHTRGDFTVFGHIIPSLASVTCSSALHVEFTAGHATGHAVYPLVTPIEWLGPRATHILVEPGHVGRGQYASKRRRRNVCWRVWLGFVSIGDEEYRQREILHATSA
ncbi:hypothetical protein BC936DRAFT_145550 [Jimgerdemannia flammicorona]|uniref:Uncharacterized protein n=1 Tax=Jimgerdemannia flammicorona TaxID=994334 RepID=A0A433D9Q0_9FUNG|nr:hypothetical protein BC936DRAFT_145550 [Jimgerdemannia flammicorona]